MKEIKEKNEPIILTFLWKYFMIRLMKDCDAYRRFNLFLIAWINICKVYSLKNNAHETRCKNKKLREEGIEPSTSRV